MKKKLNWSKIIGVALVLTQVPSLAYAGGASGVGGGGNEIAAHFADVAKKVAMTFRNQCLVPENSVRAICSSVGTFAEAVTYTQVLPRESVVGFDGKPRTAINHAPKPEIELDFHRWLAIAQNPDQAEYGIRLLAHEYAQIAGIENSDNYNNSSSLVQLLKDNYISFNQIMGKAPSPAKTQPCGLTGSIAERSQDCRTTFPGGWLLVTRNEKLQEFWQAPNGQIWSPAINGLRSEDCWAIKDLVSEGVNWQLAGKADYMNAPGLAPASYYLGFDHWSIFGTPYTNAVIIDAHGKLNFIQTSDESPLVARCVLNKSSTY